MLLSTIYLHLSKTTPCWNGWGGWMGIQASDPSKWSKHQILTLPPWTWTWHKWVLWSETTNRDPCRPREVVANWSNLARWKTNSPQKKATFGRQPPCKRDLMGRNYLTLRIPNAWRIFALLAIKKKKRKKSEQPISPTLLQYLRGSTDHQSRQGD